MERKKGWGETKDTSKQVYQVTMATRECGLKFMSPLFQQTGSKWHPSGLTESMHLPECSGLLLENALGIEKEKHQNHSNFFSFSFPIPSKAKTPVSGGTALSSSESVWTKPRGRSLETERIIYGPWNLIEFDSLEFEIPFFLTFSPFFNGNVCNSFPLPILSFYFRSQ